MPGSIRPACFDPERRLGGSGEAERPQRPGRECLEGIGVRADGRMLAEGKMAAVRQAASKTQLQRPAGRTELRSSNHRRNSAMGQVAGCRHRTSTPRRQTFIDDVAGYRCQIFDGGFRKGGNRAGAGTIDAPKEHANPGRVSGHPRETAELQRPVVRRVICAGTPIPAFAETGCDSRGWKQAGM